MKHMYVQSKVDDNNNTLRGGQSARMTINEGSQSQRLRRDCTAYVA